MIFYSIRHNILFRLRYRRLKPSIFLDSPLYSASVLRIKAPNAQSSGISFSPALFANSILQEKTKHSLWSKPKPYSDWSSCSWICAVTLPSIIKCKTKTIMKHWDNICWWEAKPKQIFFFLLWVFHFQFRPFFFTIYFPGWNHFSQPILFTQLKELIQTEIYKIKCSNKFSTNYRHKSWRQMEGNDGSYYIISMIEV